MPDVTWSSDHGNAYCYAAGCRQAECRAAWAVYRRELRARKFAEQYDGKPPAWVAPTEAQRRLRALMLDGWSIGELVSRTGLSHSRIENILQGFDRRRNGRQRPRRIKLTRISRKTHDSIVRVSKELDGHQPTNPVPNRTRLNARRKGYMPLFAWDDLGDKAEKPKGIAA